MRILVLLVLETFLRQMNLQRQPHLSHDFTTSNIITATKRDEACELPYRYLSRICNVEIRKLTCMLSSIPSLE